jgi:hypothetical protein
VTDVDEPSHPIGSRFPVASRVSMSRRTQPGSRTRPPVGEIVRPRPLAAVVAGAPLSRPPRFGIVIDSAVCLRCCQAAARDEHPGETLMLNDRRATVLEKPGHDRCAPGRYFMHGNSHRC